MFDALRRLFGGPLPDEDFKAGYDFAKAELARGSDGRIRVEVLLEESRIRGVWNHYDKGMQAAYAEHKQSTKGKS